MSSIRLGDSREERVLEADYLRGIAILMVAAVHVFGNYPDMVTSGWLLWTAVALQVIARVAVPLFLLLSAFVLVRRYYGDFSAADFYRKRLRVLLGPYLAFSFLYIGVYGLLKGWPTPSGVLRALVMASSAEHLWFFRLIFQIYLLYPVLAALYAWSERRKCSGLFLLAALLLQVGASWAESGASGPENPFWKDVRTFLLTTPQFIFYFVLGLWAGRNFTGLKQRLNASRPILTAACCGLVLGFAALSASQVIHGGPKGPAAVGEPVMFVSAMLLFYYFVSQPAGRGSRLLRVLRELGFYAYGIFLIHILFLGVLAKSLRRVHITADVPVFYPLLFISTVFLSYVGVWVLHRTPFSQILLSMPTFSKHKEI